ncbi:MAG: hypothetical protein LBS14_00275 [Holosporaceae bacterium]|nr:hypothetical protein [Holosporaceae bacterium]
MQKILLPTHLLGEDEVFLIEDVAAKLCNDINKIGEQDWWIYAARHQSKNCLRIIAGISKGIMLSRFLSVDLEMAMEISKTIMYLQRFGLKSDIKIFSSEDITRVTVKCEKFHLERTAEDISTSSVRSIVIRRNYWGKFFSSYFFYGVSLCILLVLFFIFHCIGTEKKLIASLENDMEITTKSMKFKINSKNFLAAKQFVAMLKDSSRLLQLLKKASEICRASKIHAEQVSFEKNQLKIKALLSNSLVKKLKSLCIVEQILSNEYEELDPRNKKHEVTLCIK